MQFVDKIDNLYFLNGELISKENISLNNFSFCDGFFNLKIFMIFFKIKEEDVTYFNAKNEFEQKIRACLFKFNDLSLNIDNCSIIDLIPFHIIEDYAKIRNDYYNLIIESIVGKNGFNEFYNFYVKNKDCFEVLDKLKNSFNFGDVEVAFAENFRFKTLPNSFNFLNLRKELRDIIKPDSDEFFVYACDYKQFEFRKLLELIEYNKEIFCDNLYENLGNTFKLEPDVAKQSLIAWMYSDRKNDVIDAVLDKTKILSRVTGSLFVHDGAPVYVGENEANNKKLHTIVQTNAQFFYLRKVVDILELLKSRKSKFVFPLHDSLVFFIQRDEIDLIEKISETLETDIFKIKKYVGRNYKEIEEI